MSVEASARHKVKGPCGGQDYGYDRYGNLLSKTVTTGTAVLLNVSVDASNQISSAGYDAAGKMTTVAGISGCGWGDLHMRRRRA